MLGSGPIVSRAECQRGEPVDIGRIQAGPTRQADLEGRAGRDVDACEAGWNRGRVIRYEEVAATEVIDQIGAGRMLDLSTGSDYEQASVAWPLRRPRGRPHAGTVRVMC